MTWTNLQIDILEDFADPRWYGMNLNQFELPDGVSAVTDGPITKIVSRHTPEDVTEQVLELAKTRFAWMSSDLAAELGDASHNTTTQVGKILQKAGWTAIGVSRKLHSHRWYDKARLWSLFADKLTVSLAGAEQQTGVPRRTIAKMLRSQGWAPIRTWNNDRSVWSKGEV